MDIETDEAIDGTLTAYTTSEGQVRFGTDVADISDTNQVLMVYEANPRKISDSFQESDLPSYLRKYAEYGVISRLYGANTDGRIKSLAEYWAYRYSTGLTMIKRFMKNRKTDRDYQLVISSPPGFTTVRRDPRLPSSYPAIQRAV